MKIKKLKQLEYKIICIAILLLFLAFLFYPIGSLLWKSLHASGEIGLQNYQYIFAATSFKEAIINSFMVSSASALAAVCIAFLLAFTIHYTNAHKTIKKTIQMIAGLPMLLPSITYGFAIIYSFGKQGFLTNIFHTQLFQVYGFQGIMLGYVIYILPVAFLLINNAMKYIDKKFITVSILMKDSKFQTFKMTLLRPLIGTLAVAFIQSFFLSFTDFGIPASVGGKYHVISSLLYSYMLGSIPDFAKGAVIAFVMLVPSILSIIILRYLERYNVRYKQVSTTNIAKHHMRDWLCSLCSLCICFSIVSIFAVIFIVPFMEQWPYKMNFTWMHIQAVFQDSNLLQVYKNSIFIALVTSVIGTLLSYGAALISQRSILIKPVKKLMDTIALITNTIPGMVIGISYLFVFSGTSIQNTFLIIIVCNLVHFYSTPYLMMKETLGKMNASFETTSKLLHDSWLKTHIRIITPNALATLVEVFSYYFINSMVTISAIIFIASTKTMVITTKIKELQYFNKYNEIFVLSLLILFTNIIAKAFFAYMSEYKKRKTI